MGVTEADLRAGQEKRAGRSGATVKRFDAAWPRMRPALRVAPGRPSGSSKSSTVGTATLFGLLLPDRRRPGAMTPRDGAGSPGWSGIDPIESDRRSQSLMTHDLSRKAVPPDQDRGQAFSGSCSGSDAAFKLTHCIMGVGFTSVRLGADATFRCGKPVERFFNQIRRYRCVSFSRDSSGNIGAAAPRSRRCRAPA
jgi:hypothetical protein